MNKDKAASWKMLSADVKKSDVAFILGAGVSYASFIPKWSDFVSRLAEAVAPQEERLEERRLEGKRLVRWCASNHWGLPVVTSVIRERFNARKSCSESDSWIETIREGLYRDFLADLRVHGVKLPPNDRPKKENPDLARRLEEQNPTLTSLVSICTASTERGWLPVRRVRAVLNYNIDGLVQLYDRARHGTPRMFRTIERSSTRGAPEKIPLYQLHGYLQPMRTDARQEAGDAIVLCEEEYHDRTDDAYSFQTTSILWALRECIAVFVGCSMIDELMRRSLHRARRDRAQALRAQGHDEEVIETALMRHYAVMLSRDSEADDLVEADLRRLGVRVLWVADFSDELPTRLRELGHELARPRNQGPLAGSTAL